MRQTHELENLRRSFVMLHPEARPLVRDQAVELVEQLAEVQRRLRRLCDDLRKVLEEAESG